MILDGKKISNLVKEEVRNEVIKIIENGKKISLAVVFLGNDNASRIYIRNKKIACRFTKISSIEYNLQESTKEEDLLLLIDRLNNDDNINGILVQMPLPSHIDEKKVIERINPIKDVDCFSQINKGKLMGDENAILPCTPAGIIELLKRYNIDIAGKNCTVIGRSNIVGKPMAFLLLKENGTVTICHSHTKNLSLYTKNADIIVSAIGKPKFLKKEDVSFNTTIIDVGINRDKDNKLCGDVDFDEVSKVVKNITPVPGGVGPMTIAMLMKNVLTSYNNQRG